MDIEIILSSANMKIFAAEIWYGGETVLHYADGEDIRRPVYSAAKSVTSAAFTLAWDDGLVSPEMPLADFLENKYRPLMTEDFSAMPFERFLTMTAGHYPFRPEGDDWTGNILSLAADIDLSDKGFHYSNIPAYLVGAAVENAVGGDLMGYLNKRLFAPLGIPEPTYRKSPEGHFYGATGMEFTAHELALLGRLYLQRGVWNGSRLMNEKTVARAVSRLTDTGAGDGCGYGYFFRVAEDHFCMVGKWGQRCMVYPDRGLVTAYLSHQPDRSEELYALMRRVSDTVSGVRWA